MARKMTQFRDADLSLWQSATDEAAAKAKAHGNVSDMNSPITISRPDPNDPMIAASSDLGRHVKETGEIPAVDEPQAIAQGLVDTAKFCSTTAFQLAKAKLLGDTEDAKRLQEQLTVKMGPCDLKWSNVVEIYLANKALGNNIPYRRHKNIGDFVIDDVLKDNAKVALLADWGTGDNGAKLLLRQIAEKKPDVVIHLGDVYYSGTEYEYQNYFYKIWQETFGLEKVSWGEKPKCRPALPTFTLAGNHDMYAGGKPYYVAIDMLGQPSSYFCLRNTYWQFIALDTSLHDCDPVHQAPTYLDDAEVEWLKDKIAMAVGRKTILLSHHQLFTAFEGIGPDKAHVNDRLLEQVKDILPHVSVWFWGHEHNLVIYERAQGVLARCIGHGAFPVEVEAPSAPWPDLPIKEITLTANQDKSLYQHGYVILDFAGDTAKATYYQFEAESQEESALLTEELFAPERAVGFGAMEAV